MIQAIRKHWSKLLILVIGALLLTPVITKADPGDPIFVTTTSPVNGAIDVPIDIALSAYFFQPNIGVGVDATTLTDNTVKLYPTANPGAQVTAQSINSSGGSDVISFTPATLLQINTQYTFEITDGVLDETGTPFTPYVMSFTTGENGGPTPTTVSFTKVSLASSVSLNKYASVDVGPDGRLYAVDVFGNLHVWNIQADGTLGPQMTHNILPNRAIIGIEFDPNSTPTNPILWVTHNDPLPYFGQPPRHFSGALSRLTVENFGQGNEGWNETLYVWGLPRSVKDHLTNSLEFGPDDALYLTQGSISAMGSRDNAWGQEPETILSAAVLRVDIQSLQAMAPETLPVNVSTGIPDAGGGLPDINNYSLGDPELASLYDPQAPGAPVTLFGTGIRNGYDLLWHSNGRLYVPTNGSANGGSAATPGTPNPLPAACNHRIDAGFNGAYNGPQVPHAGPLPFQPALSPTDPLFIQPQYDYLFMIEEGGYYGHPNPTRCEWVLNGGNPTDQLDYGQRGNHYPVGTQPDRNYRGYAYNFQMNKSANGVDEYRSNTFGGALRGYMLVARYSQNDDFLALLPGEDGIISDVIVGIPGLTNFINPLDIAEDTRNGNLYVSEYGDEFSLEGTIVLLRPDQPGTPEVVANDDDMLFDTVANTVSPPQSVMITSTGAAPLNINAIVINGVNADQFQLVNPPALPLQLQGGASITVDVTFNPTSTGTKNALLQIQNNAPLNSTVNVSLHGLSTQGTGGGQEPSLQWVLDAHSIGINVGDDNPNTGIVHSSNFAADLLGPHEIEADLFAKAGPGPVTVETLALYGPEKPGEPASAGWYRYGNHATLNHLFDINTGEYQTLNPGITGVTSFDPGPGSAFGFYSRWPFFGNRVVYGDGSLNTWDTTTGHHVRVYEYRNASGVIVPNWYILATEEHTSGWDYNDIVLLVKNVTPTSNVASGSIDITNPAWDMLLRDGGINGDGFEYMDEWFMLQRIIGFETSRDFPWEVPVRIHNISETEPLDVTEIEFSNAAMFDLPNGETSFTVAPGAHYDLVVRFIWTELNGARTDLFGETLTIHSTDPLRPEANITLRALLQANTGGSYEPDFGELMYMFGWEIEQGSWTGSTHPQGGDAVPSNPIGEEVYSVNWRRLDPTEPMYTRFIAAFHGFSGENAQIQGSVNLTMHHSSRWSNSVLPENDDDARPVQTLLEPTGDIRFRIANRTACNGACTNNHGLRFFPIRDPQGTLIPGAYVVGQDYTGGGANHDFQDDIVMFTNARPSNVTVDLVASSLANPNTVDVGEQVTLNFNLYNDSLHAAAGVNYNLNLPASLNPVSITPSKGACTGTACNIGTVGGQATVTIEVVATAVAVGPTSASASASTSTNEPNTGNNNTTVNLTINEVTTGDITIIKDAIPDSEQPFGFTGDGGIGNFQLIDNGGVVITDFATEVNFQVDMTPIDDFVPDMGLPYGPRANGETYGWRTMATGTPIDSSGIGSAGGTRDRGNAGTLLSTLNHMQRGDCCTGGFTEAIYWEHAVPNGRYEVTVMVGDNNNETTVGTRHVVNAEGVNVVDYTPPLNQANQHMSGTAIVDVFDGVLTLDPIGGFNTKINYVIIEGVEAAGNSITFEDLSPATYTITETLPGGWVLNGVACEGASGAVTNVTNGVAINLQVGDDVICTFTNANVNVPQVVNNDLLTLAEGTTATISDTLLLYTDANNTAAELVYTLVLPPANGTLLLDGTPIDVDDTFTQADISANLLVYQHNGAETIVDAFDFEITDGEITDPINGTFIIDISPVNDAPSVIHNDTLPVTEGTTVALGQGVLEFEDPDNLTSDLVYTVTTAPAHGILLVNSVEENTFTQAQINAGLVEYAHGGGEEGSDSFAFSLTDGLILTPITGTFNINVLPVNDLPIMVVDQTLAVLEGTSGTVGNNLLQFSDADNTTDELTYTLTSITVNGTLALDTTPLAVDDTFTQADIDDGLVVYTHDGTETTTDSFDYELSDGIMADAITGTFNIEILEENDAPTTVEDDGTVDEGGQIVIDVIANDSDEDGGLDITSVAIDTLPTNGVAVPNGDGTVTYTHDGSETLTDTFTYTVDDLLGATSTATTVTITITPVNDAPTLTVNNGLLLQVSTTATIDGTLLAANDVDDDNTGLTFTVTTLPVNGNLLRDGVIIATSGTFTQGDITAGLLEYQHNGITPQIDAFTFTVSDGDLATTEATFTIDIVDPTSPLPIELYVSGDTTVYPLDLAYNWRHQINIGDTQVPGDWYNVVIMKDNEVVINEWADASVHCEGVLCALPYLDKTPPYVFNSGNYSWWVIAWEENNGQWTSTYSDEAIFTINVPIIEAPTGLIATPNQGRPTISWDNDAGATWYEIWMGNASTTAFHQWVEKTSTLCADARCTLTPNINPAPGTYDVWMRSWGPAGFSTGGMDGWSGPASVTIAADAPSIINTGLNASLSESGNTMLHWQGVAHATWYQVWLGTNNSTIYMGWQLAADLGCENMGTCTLNVGQALPAGDYTWAVQAWGPGGFNNGDANAWSTLANFNSSTLAVTGTSAPPPPTNDGPANNGDAPVPVEPVPARGQGE